MAIRHAVSLRGTFALLSVDSADAIFPRFLALLGMTFQVRLRSLPRALGLLRRIAPRNDRRGVPLLAMPREFRSNDDSYLYSWD